MALIKFTSFKNPQSKISLNLNAGMISGFQCVNQFFAVSGNNLLQTTFRFKN